MEFKGTWNINNKKMVGTCSIDDNNDITLTIHKSGLENCKIISGDTNNGEVVLYNTRLIDHGPGFFKYRCEYAVNDEMFLKLPNNDQNKKIDNIVSCSYELDDLDIWICEKYFSVKENIIECNVFSEIILINDKDMKIFIRIENSGLKDVANSTNLKMINNKPIIVVKFSNPQSRKKVIQTIRMINRFFSLLFGYAPEIKNIKCKWKLPKFEPFSEFILYSNFHFQINSSLRKAYINSFRIKCDDIKDKLEYFFRFWMKMYHDPSYQNVLNFYFISEKTILIEERFLQISKVLENLYDIQYRDDKKNLDALKTDLNYFYHNHKAELTNILNIHGINKKHIKKFSENSIINYLERVSFDEKIKKLDTNKKIDKYFNKADLDIIKNDTKDGYNAIRNTRNYYTHLEEKNDVIRIDSLLKYSLLMELIIIKEILLKLNFKTSLLTKIIDNEPYISIDIVNYL